MALPGRACNLTTPGYESWPLSKGLHQLTSGLHLSRSQKDLHLGIHRSSPLAVHHRGAFRERFDLLKCGKEAVGAVDRPWVKEEVGSEEPRSQRWPISLPAVAKARKRPKAWSQAKKETEPVSR
ncbi:hypothetical protein MHYP_G00083470 [Metynnis hypsauchen]